MSKSRTHRYFPITINIRRALSVEERTIRSVEGLNQVAVEGHWTALRSPIYCDWNPVLKRVVNIWNWNYKGP